MKKITYLLIAFLISFAAKAQILNQVKKAVSNSKTTTATNNGPFQEGEKVEVYDPIEKGWFPSAVLKVQDGKYFIHFDNYDAKWDTWVTPERVRQAGKGNKNDPPPTTTNANNTSNTTVPVETSNTTPVAVVSNTAVQVSDNPGPADLPVIYSKDKSIVFRIGDPVSYVSKGTKTIFTIANMDYNGKFKGIKCYGYYEGDIDLENVDLVEGYNYAHYPSGAVNGAGNKFKEGDKVEVFCRYDQFSEYKWEKAIVVSVDIDNYYVYRPKTTGVLDEEYYWQYINDIRAIGSDKTTVVPPQNRRNSNPNLNAYAQALENANCEDVGKRSSPWYFLWLYRHEFNPVDGSDTRLAFNTGTFKTILDGYNCLYDVRKQFPDLGVSGAEIYNRFDVQWEFLQKRNEFITLGLQRKALAEFNTFLAEMKRGDYPEQLANFKGLEKLKTKITERNKSYDEPAGMLGITIQYPWELLEKSYEEGVQKFMTDGTVEYKGLVYQDVPYTAKDSKAEMVAIKYVKEMFPNSTVLSSGTSSEFYINKDNIGIPRNRAKGVVVIHKNPNYRTCIITYLYYQEEYAGGGVYKQQGEINGQLVGNRYLKTCK